MMNMKPLSFLLFLSFVTSGIESKFSFKESKIFNGISKRIWNHPYMAALEKRLESFCAACQIAAKWLATAAHCFLKRTKEEVQVRIGSSFRLTYGTVYNISRLVPHPNFSERNYANDLLLIEIEKAVTPTKSHSPIKLFAPTDSFIPGTLITISGWGFKNPEGQNPKLLQAREVKIIETYECIEKYRTYYNKSHLQLNPREFCVSTDIATICTGDSGGPGVIHGKLAGIVSRGSALCKLSVLPTILTSIADFYFWIRSIISYTS